jgi:hypothetical protein
MVATHKQPHHRIDTVMGKGIGILSKTRGGDGTHSSFWQKRKKKAITRRLRGARQGD